MTRTRIAGIAAVALAWAASGALGQPQPSEAVRRAADTYFGWVSADSLYVRMRLGLPIERLPDLSLAKLESDAARAAALRKSLEGLDTARLDHDDVLSLDVLRRRLREMEDAPRFYWLTFDVTPYASPLGMVGQVVSNWSFPDAAAADRYLAFLGQLPAFLGTMREKLEAQEGRGIRITRDELDLSVAMLRSFAAPPDRSPFAVAQERLAKLPADRAAAFRGQVAAEIEKRIDPALTSLADYLAGGYRTVAPTAVGLSQYPGGREYYEWLVRFHTTLDVTPEEVHRIGLSEVERLGQQMDAVQARIGFQGTRAEFRAALQKDPRFYRKTPEEIGEALMAPIRRIEPKIRESFLRLPKAPYGVERLEPTLEAGQTFGYYEPPTANQATGYYHYNGSDLANRSLLGSAHLMYHELIPGHHFQICLAIENPRLPAFRREGSNTAYEEGWGEYATSVAGELGMYSDPYDDYGRLAFESFIATRLVVDTGMSALGWSRERAVAYMRENELISDEQIRTESLRYCCDTPGQALAYRMGHLKIQALREKAKTALASRFDVRRFHDAVLGSGSLPLSTLELHVDWFIEGEKKAAAGGSGKR